VHGVLLFGQCSAGVVTARAATLRIPLLTKLSNIDRCIAAAASRVIVGVAVGAQCPPTAVRLRRPKVTKT
jgi:hypothetical protein